MRRNEKTVRWLAVWLLIMAVLHGAEWTALAEEGTLPDMARQGSVCVTLKASDGSTATDGVLALYRVADLKLDKDGAAYEYTPDFKDSGLLLSKVTTGSLAEAFVTYVTDQGLTGMEKAVGNDGTVVFSNLSLGLYLVVQTGQSTGFYRVKPFLVSVPLEEGGFWAYDVDARPKVETLRPVPGEPGESEEPDEPEGPEKQEESETWETPQEPFLPRTGQQNRLVRRLAALGAILFVSGLMKHFRSYVKH